MAMNTSSTCINSTTDDTTERYYNKSYRSRKNYWKSNDNFNYNENYNNFGPMIHDPTSYKCKQLFTTINNDLINIPIIEAFCLPPSHQRSMERYYKILCTLTLMGNTSIGSSMNLTRSGLIDKASEVVRKVCLITKDNKNLLTTLDIQLQEIEKITTNMASDMGLTVVSTTSLRILKSPQETVINMLACKNVNTNILYEPVTILDDKNIYVKRNYDCFRVEGVHVQMTGKIYLKNTKNVNVLGRIIGPRGNTIKGLENSTHSKITIRGRGSMRNSVIEKNLFRQKICEHLNEPLHILITVYGTSEVDCYKKLEYVRKKIIFTLCQKPLII
uniref:KH domain-containing protein n=1 Tax=Strongyloides stercoralis TaxID=6248 RepID=A0A0K0E7P3_STRER